MKQYLPWQDSSRFDESTIPQLQIPLTPPDWYPEKNLSRESDQLCYEVDHTIDKCVIISDI